MLLYNLLTDKFSVAKFYCNVVNRPPEFLHAVEANHTLDVLHPALRSGGKAIRCLRKRCLRERCHWGLREVAALGRGGIEPESPRRVKGMLSKIIQRR